MRRLSSLRLQDWVNQVQEELCNVQVLPCLCLSRGSVCMLYRDNKADGTDITHLILLKLQNKSNNKA